MLTGSVFVWLDLIVVLAIYRSVFKGGSVTEAASHAPDGVPPWIAKLLALEARFWLTVWGKVKRVLGKR